jgi:hypothetical protein
MKVILHFIKEDREHLDSFNLTNFPNYRPGDLIELKCGFSPGRPTDYEIVSFRHFIHRDCQGVKASGYRVIVKEA